MMSAFLTLMLAVSLLGCGKQAPPPRHIVILLDVSGSIDRDSLQQAFKAIDDLAGQLHRGDRFAIIPILGDAQAEASGRIIRFEVPKARQAYDSNLRQFRVKLQGSLEKLKVAANTHPGSKTDIWGSIALADQEFQADPGESKKQLLILSDFIEEDGEIDFRKDRRLQSREASEKFAESIAKANPLDFKGISVYLGRLRSKEYAALSRSRREAIQGFWIGYFRLSHGRTEVVTDGVGLVDLWVGPLGKN